MTSELCKNKIHAMTGDNVLLEKGKNRRGDRIEVRRCKACRLRGNGANVKYAREHRARDLAEMFRPIMERRGGWEERAACFGCPVERFIPENATPLRADVRQTVAEYCDSPCPVRALCLGHALAYGDVSGIWGGMLLPQQIMEVDALALAKEITG